MTETLPHRPTLHVFSRKEHAQAFLSKLLEHNPAGQIDRTRLRFTHPGEPTIQAALYTRIGEEDRYRGVPYSAVTFHCVVPDRARATFQSLIRD